MSDPQRWIDALALRTGYYARQAWQTAWNAAGVTPLPRNGPAARAAVSSLVPLATGFVSTVRFADIPALEAAFPAAAAGTGALGLIDLGPYDFGAPTGIQNPARVCMVIDTGGGLVWFAAPIAQGTRNGLENLFTFPAQLMDVGMDLRTAHAYQGIFLAQCSAPPPFGPPNFTRGGWTPVRPLDDARYVTEVVSWTGWGGGAFGPTSPGTGFVNISPGIQGVDWDIVAQPDGRYVLTRITPGVLELVAGGAPRPFAPNISHTLCLQDVDASGVPAGDTLACEIAQDDGIGGVNVTGALADVATNAVWQLLNVAVPDVFPGTGVGVRSTLSCGIANQAPPPQSLVATGHEVLGGASTSQVIVPGPPPPWSARFLLTSVAGGASVILRGMTASDVQL